MKANELMIGDWVMCGNTPYQIAEISIGGTVCVDYENELFTSLDDIEPISLTAEILEKNGFESTPAPSERVWRRNSQEVWLDNEGKNYWANLKNGEFYFEGYIEYVHELQHALRLCGIENEIELNGNLTK